MLQTAQLESGDYVVSTRGELDAYTIESLRDMLFPLAAVEHGVVLDIGDVHRLDPRTLAIIACAGQMLRRNGHRLTLVSRSPFVVHLLAERGLGDLIRLRGSLWEATHDD